MTVIAFFNILKMQPILYLIFALAFVYEFFIFNQEAIIYLTFVCLFLILLSTISSPLTQYFELLKVTYVQQSVANFQEKIKLADYLKTRYDIKNDNTYKINYCILLIAHKGISRYYNLLTSVMIYHLIVIIFIRLNYAYIFVKPIS